MGDQRHRSSPHPTLPVNGEEVSGSQDMGRMLVGIGLLLTVVGGVILLVERIPGLGRLPGDIIVERKNFTFYFPLATSILVSVVLSLFFWLFRR